MVVQPFNYQKRTNIEEHNQIVDKLNEVVDAVNNIDPSGQGLEPRVTALETDVTDLGVRVDSVESKNLQQDTAITDIRADAETTKNRLGTAEGNIATLTGKVTQLETDTTDLDGRVTDIDGRLTTLAGNYTTLGGRVDTLNTEVGQLTTKTTNLETGKVNVAQGVANAGKVLGIGADGNVTPVEQSGGGSSFPYAEEISNMSASDLIAKLKQGDELQIDLRSYKMSNVNMDNASLEAKGDLSVINGTITFGESYGSYPVHLVVCGTNDYGYLTFANSVIYEATSELESSVNNVTLKRVGHGVTIAEALSPSGITTRTFVNAYVFADNPTIIPRMGYVMKTRNTTSFTGRIIHNS